MDKKISVIIPVYNVEEYLEKAVMSCVFQTYNNLEIILVNDGSTDSSLDICKKLADKYAMVHIIDKKNGGLSSARNAGLEYCTGELIYFLDSDDYIHPNTLEEMVNLMNMYESDIVECGFERIVKDVPFEDSSLANITVYGAKQAIESLIEWKKCVPMVWNKLYKKNIIGDLKFIEGKIHEDEFFTYKVLYNAKKIVYTDRKYYYYRQRENSIMRQAMTIKKIDALEAQFERLEFINEVYPDLCQKTVQAYFVQCLNVLKHCALYNVDEKQKKQIQLETLKYILKISKYVEHNYYNKNILRDIKIIKLSKTLYIKMRSCMFKLERKRKAYLLFKRIIKLIKYIFKLPQKSINYKRKINNINAIKQFKNKYEGQRCFIIGNGPSLRIEDLEKLKNEITFAANKIYLVFDKTDWRPTFYCIQDGVMLHECFEDINKIKGITKFISDNEFVKYGKRMKKSISFKLNTERYAPNLPKFSEKIEECIYEGFTVTYGEIQLAAYMGFKEIYLLGVDFNYSIKVNEYGEIIKDDNIKDYFLDNYVDQKEKRNPPNLINSFLAYKSAERYSRENGIRVFNSTRGGKLEVFERVDFDKVIN